MDQSIWAARSVWSDSKSFYDEPRVTELRLKLDRVGDEFGAVEGEPTLEVRTHRLHARREIKGDQGRSREISRRSRCGRIA